MPKKPTPADATLILKLYDLRREAEIRKVAELGMPIAHVARTLRIPPPWYAPAWPAGPICYGPVVSAARRR